MIAIVNYGAGNLFSLSSSLRYLGIESEITDSPERLRQADRVILPGVGAFGDAIDMLRKRGLDQAVLEEARRGKPLMGICLGMQLLFDSSCEYGNHQGLGLIPGAVKNLREALGDEPLKVPHMGWNSLELSGNSPLMKYTAEGAHVYFVHSFYAEVSGYTVAAAAYGPVRVTGAAQKDNVCGTQFHPEKSGKIGLEMLRAFSEM